MYNQIDAILSQYEMEVYEVTKGRGTHICNTSKGKFVLTGFRGSKEKGDLLREYLSKLKNQGFIVEQIEINKNVIKSYKKVRKEVDNLLISQKALAASR